MWLIGSVLAFEIIICCLFVVSGQINEATFNLALLIIFCKAIMVYYIVIKIEALHEHAFKD
jgi:hypothetical protein